MKHCKRLLSLLLAMAVGLSLAVPALADGAASAPDGSALSPDEPVRAIVLYGGNADPDRMARTLGTVPGTELLYCYSLLFSGAAVETTAAALETLEALDGVDRVVLSQTHSQPRADAASLPDSNSLSVMGFDLPREPGLNGDGMVIAVLDTGLRATHEAFTDYGLAQSPAISREDAAAFVSEGGTPGVYLSARIPFAYDYYEGDQDVSSSSEHGTHVSALAAGYALNEDGTVKFQGAAPAAQLLCMKVFPDNADAGADDAVILKAMEDAFALGADVINLSLGSDNGFSRDGALDGLYCAAFQRLREAGVILCCAAGNSSTILTQKSWGVPLPTGDYTDYGSVGSPGAYLGAASIAAVNTTSYLAFGCIEAGGKKLSYQAGSPTEGSTLPALSTLAGEPLTYVAVGGVGTAEDFAGLDLSGKVALVSRGGITFTEKAQNAADAGAAACLIYNNEEGDIIPAVETLPIPCAALSQADGAYLLQLAGEAGTGALTVHMGVFLLESRDRPTILEASAWGTTSDLRLVPTLAAPGGSILSAAGQADTDYALLSGTSMASANAAGAFAVLLQALRERGYTDRAEAAGLAEQLLESTAVLLTGEDGTPLSPRRQGAGLIDLSAALNTGVVITQPLLELGDSASGQFTLSFDIRNLTQNSVTLSLSAAVLTDDYAVDDESGSYSLLTPLDITGSVTVSGPSSVTVPGGGTRAVKLTLTVDQSLRRELAEVYSNGFFTEGYLTADDAEGHTVHAAFLGYCGDWSAAPIVEQTDFRDVLNATAMLAETVDEETGQTLLELGFTYLDVLPVNLGANLPYLTSDGSLPYDAPLLGENAYGHVLHSDARNALAGQETDAVFSGGSQFFTEVYTLRNAAHLIMVVSDARTGDIYYVDDTPWLTKATLDEFTSEYSPSGWFCWDGLDAGGNPLPDNTQVNVEFYGWLDSDSGMCAAYERQNSDMERPESYRWLTGGGYDSYIEWSFPITIDASAPALAGAPVYDAARNTLTVTLTDNQFLAYAAIYDGENALLAEEICADETAGTSHALTADLSAYETLPDTLYVAAADYASNLSGISIDLSAVPDGETVSVSSCAMALLTDVDRSAWYHEAVDYVCAAGLMTGLEAQTFRPGENVTRAEAVTILYRLAGGPAPAGEDGDPAAGLPFTDVMSSVWFWDALLWSYSSGLVNGFDAATFGGFAYVTRQQLAVMLYRYVILTGGGAAPNAAADLSVYSDGDRVDGWAREAMAWAVGEGLLSACSDGTLRPGSYVTRAEAAQILMRFLGG